MQTNQMQQLFFYDHIYQVTATTEVFFEWFLFIKSLFLFFVSE